MVHMTCCDRRYATVAETVAHECPAEAPEVRILASMERMDGSPAYYLACSCCKTAGWYTAKLLRLHP